MWQSENNIVQDYLEQSSTIRSKALIVAEWNLNISDNIDEIGNYRNRPDSVEGNEDYVYHTVPETFVSETALSNPAYYFGATDSDVAIDGGFDDNGEPQIFTSPQKKMKTLFSLEDCFNRFRPRSGINKAVYFDGKFLNRVYPDMARQPRFYFPTPDDKFKYWTSLRTQSRQAVSEAQVLSVYPSVFSKTIGVYVTKISIPDNDFAVGDYITITGSTLPELNNSFLVQAASSSIIKVHANINTTASEVTVGPDAVATGNTTFNELKGISYRSYNDYPIDDAAPFVVYKAAQPANRLVVKMQTKVGDIDAAPQGGYIDENGNPFEDPFFDTETNRVKAVPESWRIDVLNSNNEWVLAKSFDALSTRDDGSAVIGPDGYVELAYGLNNIPDEYKNNIVFVKEISSIRMLPVASPVGYAWLIKDSSGPGTYYVSNGKTDDDLTSNYSTFIPTYGWYLNQVEVPINSSSFVSDLTDPNYFMQGEEKIYRELAYIKGMRIVVDSMTINEATFDLIEMSPRLSADITDMVTGLSVTKHASDLGDSGLPVGRLLSSTGNLEIFDHDQSFNPNNDKSLIRYLSTKNLQIKIYETLLPEEKWQTENINQMIYSIPIKTLYADGFPKTNAENRQVSITLRDLFFYLESMQAPELLIPNASFSMAVSCLLDSIGFSNYTFKRVKNSEDVIPYFYIGPDTTVAEALENLAVATQTAIFFDEYNNLVFMSKEYLMPKDESTRATDITLYGDNVYIDGKTYQANISQIQSVSDEVHNDGKISYETKYIQRSYSSLSQANLVDSEKTWVYKPVLLWEVSPEENTKSWNDESSKQSSYTLAAIPLDSNLSNSLPEVIETESGKRVITNNTIDLGEAVYWLSRYNGYLYANGEIIKFDAVEYNVPTNQIDDLVADGTSGKTFITMSSTMADKLKEGYILFDQYGSFLDDTKVKSVTSTSNRSTTLTVNLTRPLSASLSSGITGTSFSARSSKANVWITDVEEYQRYFAKVPFGGKIYPTGRVRIYSEPYYDEENKTLRLGAVAKHGRAQFGTSVVTHLSGLSENWTNPNNVKKCYMRSSFMFNGGTLPITYQNVRSGVLNTGSHNADIRKAATAIGTATATGVIKNFLSSKNITEKDSNKLEKTIPGTIQSSALVFDGPSYPSPYNPQDFIQYIPKKLDSMFTHFQTRMRIIGSMEDEKSKTQTPVGSTPYYTVGGKNVGGSSGGLGIWVDPLTNCGYYFEIVALTDTTANAYTGTASAINTLFFYKIQSDSGLSNKTDTSVNTSNVGKGVPILLWSGLAPILVDDGRFSGQNRLANETNPTVYDIGVEFKKVGTRVEFNMYLNDQLVGTAVDKDPLKQTSYIAPFLRGSSRVMFENISAVAGNFAESRAGVANAPVESVFGFDNKSTSRVMKKYSISGAIKSTFLDGLSTKGSPSQYNIYFEEFGTIMREMSYFKIKYDKAYPALFAKISPTFNDNQGYAVSGFVANAFGAEFMIFNVTDSVLSLDSGSGNYLRIQGVAFTQNSRHDLTVDEYFKKHGDMSDPEYNKGKTYNADYEEAYDDIKKSRLTYGNKAFSINTPYLQSQDAADSLMKWLVGKVMKPRKAISLEIFSMPTLQLGDIVKIDYNKNGISQVSENDLERYLVYSIEYQRSEEGPSMIVYLSEVS